MTKMTLNDALDIDAVEKTTGFEAARADLVEYDQVVNDAVVTVSEESDFLDVLVTNSDRLEQYSALMNKSLESADNGLDSTAAKALDIAIESINDVLGVDGYGVSSLEAFESPASRADATTDAIAALEATMGKVGQGVRNLIDKIWRKIKIFVAKFLANTNRLGAALAAAATKINEMKKGKYKVANGKITNRSLLADIYDDDGKDTITTTLMILATGAKFVSGINSQSLAHGSEGGYNQKASAGTSEIMGGKTVTIEEGNKLTIKKRTGPSSKDLSASELSALVSQAATIVPAINKLKGYTAMVDKAATSIGKAVTDRLEGEVKADEVKKYREAAQGITRMAMFYTVTLMGCLHKGGTAVVKLVNTVAKENKGDFKNSNAGNDEEANPKLEQFNESDAFADFWAEEG